MGLVALAAIGLVACRPVPPRPAPAPPPPLPAAPGGVAVSPLEVDQDCDPTTAKQVVDAPDPFVFRNADGTYYAFTTQVKFTAVPVYKSTDLVNWEAAGVDSAAPGTCPNGSAELSSSWAQPGCNWAPSVLHRPGQQYVMYYTARLGGSWPCGGTQCIGKAVSATPDGPYVDSFRSPIICPPGGAIDASPFVDGGLSWLTYKTEDSRIWITQLSTDGQGNKVGGDVLLLTNAGGWEAPRIEGPTMMRAGGSLFLFYSAGAWNTDGYKVGVARCNAPTGPCTRIYSTAVLDRRDPMLGPGGQTPFQDAAGNWQMMFHAWQWPHVGYNFSDPNDPARRSMRLLPLNFTGGNPRVG